MNSLRWPPLSGDERERRVRHTLFERIKFFYYHMETPSFVVTLVRIKRREAFVTGCAEIHWIVSRHTNNTECVIGTGKEPACHEKEQRRVKQQRHVERRIRLTVRCQSECRGNRHDQTDPYTQYEVENKWLILLCRIVIHCP